MACNLGLNNNKIDIKLTLEEEDETTFHKNIFENLESIDIKLNFSKEKKNSTINYSLKNIVCENFISKSDNPIFLNLLIFSNISSCDSS